MVGLNKRYVLSTKALKGSTITWWGKHRWSIEGFFKTAKYRFGLHRFGQGTLLGVYRWLMLSLIAYLLALGILIHCISKFTGLGAGCSISS